MMQIARPDLERMNEIIAYLDTWESAKSDRVLDCKIAYTLGFEWFTEDISWRQRCEQDGFENAWTYEPVWQRGAAGVPAYTSSWDAVMQMVNSLAPEFDQMSTSQDPSGCSADVGKWNLSAPYVEGEEPGDAQLRPYGWAYHCSPLLALLQAFLIALRQKEFPDFKDRHNERGPRSKRQHGEDGQRAA